MSSNKKHNKTLKGKAEHKVRNVFALQMGLRNGGGFHKHKLEEKGGAKMDLIREPVEPTDNGSVEDQPIANDSDQCYDDEWDDDGSEEEYS